MRTDIAAIRDIRLLVDTFYDKVREDVLLANIFDERIRDRWPEHLEKMYRFWQTILLEEHTYFGSPFPPHAQLPVDSNHFDRWVQLFEETVDTLFEGDKANRAKWQGRRMAEIFLSKISYIRNQASVSAPEQF